MRVSQCPTMPGRPETGDCIVQTPSVELIQLAKQNKQASKKAHNKTVPSDILLYT